QPAAGEQAGVEEVATAEVEDLAHLAPPFAASSAAAWIALRIRGYVPHRHRLPDMASSMSASVGRGVSRSSTAAAMIWPDWQYPHCGTSASIHATCSGCRRSGARPSMVTTFLPAARRTGVTHDRTASPSRCTVQAP